MLAASITGVNSVDIASLDGIESVKADESIKNEAQSEPETTEAQVDKYFINNPILSKVAFCESRYRQFDANGEVLRGVVNSKDVGVMQINEYYHLDSAVRLGLDIYTLEGNMAYAQYLYDTQGVAPWVHSSKCWSKGESVALNN
jgi:hypothetical protein